MIPRPDAATPELLAQIARAIRGIRYGAVHIIIQDARVVQIETSEKIRLANGSVADLTPGGS